MTRTFMLRPSCQEELSYHPGQKGSRTNPTRQRGIAAPVRRVGATSFRMCSLLATPLLEEHNQLIA
jgi:hypothetical protein